MNPTLYPPSQPLQFKAGVLLPPFLLGFSPERARPPARVCVSLAFCRVARRRRGSGRTEPGGGGACSWKSPAWGVGHILGWDSIAEADTNKQREGESEERAGERSARGGGEGGARRPASQQPASQPALAQLGNSLSLSWKVERRGCAVRGCSSHVEAAERRSRARKAKNTSQLAARGTPTDREEEQEATPLRSPLCSRPCSLFGGEIRLALHFLPRLPAAKPPPFPSQFFLHPSLPRLDFASFRVVGGHGQQVASPCPAARLRSDLFPPAGLGSGNSPRCSRLIGKKREARESAPPGREVRVRARVSACLPACRGAPAGVGMGGQALL